MTFSEDYPHKRILIGFTLCPSFVVFCFYLSLAVVSLTNVSDWSEFSKVVQEQFISILAAGALSVLAGQFFSYHLLYC